MTDSESNGDGNTRYRVEGWLSMPISATLLADPDDDIDDISLEEQQEALLHEIPEDLGSVQEFARMDIDVDYIELDE